MPISSQRAAKNGTLSFVAMTERDQRRHVLGGVVRLQPGGAVGDQRVAGGVGLVERVVSRLLVRRPQPLDDVAARCPTPRSPRGTRGSSLAIACAVLLADRLAQVVGLGARRSRPAPWRSASPAPGRGSRPSCGSMIGAQALVGELDRLRVALAARVGRDLVHRARAVERDERDEVVELGRADLAAAPPACPRTRTGRRRSSRRARASRRSSASSSGSVVMSGRSPVERSMMSSASSMTSRLRRPRKSIFSRPSSSTGFIENCVTMR